MVEVEVHCVGGDHNFKITFPDPVDWGAVKAVMVSEEIRCEQHKMSFWTDE